VSSRELVVLGTASQAPTRTRNHTGYVLRWDTAALLFDPGEGTQRQMTLAGVASPRLGRICVTHAHNDHCLGLPGVLARMALDQPGRDIVVHGPAAATAHLAALAQVSASGLPVRVQGIAPGGGEAEIATVAGCRLTARALDHRIPAVGYRLAEPDGIRFLPERLAEAGLSGPDVGRLQREGELRGVQLADVTAPRRGQVFAFVMDTRLCPAVDRLVAGADLAVVESTFLDRDADLAATWGHLTARQAVLTAARAGVRRLVLTHFSQRYADPAEYAAEARAALAEAGATTQVIVAADLDVVEVPPRE
jgi:ribonuclease Z